MKTQQQLDDIMSTMGVVLRTVPGSDVIEKVTVVATYAELMSSHPDVPEYRRFLAGGLNALASVLDSRDARELSRRTRSLLFAG